MKRLVLVFAAACGGGSGSSADAPIVTELPPPPNPDGPAACPRVAPTGDHAHVIVISHPFAQSGGDSNRWETLTISATGQIALTHHEFEMGSQSAGQLAVTPDGEIAIAAQDDGTLGVVRLAADGTPTVVDAHFSGASPFYATGVVMAPSGDHAYVLDQQTRNNGGGVYRVDIACDGSLTDRGMVVAAKSPGGLIFLSEDTAVIAAGDVGPAGSAGATAVGNDAELLHWSDTPMYLGGGDLFGDDTSIVGGTALTADGSTILVGDVNQFSSGEGINRVAIGAIGTTLTPVAVLPIDDPIALVPSPFGNVVLSVSGFGNAMYVLDKGGTGGAWRVRGQVTYMGAHPELPSGAVPLSGGALAGNVLVAELSGVRRVELRADGSVVDDGRFLIGDGSGDDIADIVGAIGVTP